MKLLSSGYVGSALIGKGLALSIRKYSHDIDTAEVVLVLLFETGLPVFLQLLGQGGVKSFFQF